MAQFEQLQTGTPECCETGGVMTLTEGVGRLKANAIRITETLRAIQHTMRAEVTGFTRRFTGYED